MLNLNSFNQLSDQIMQGMSYMGDDMSKVEEYRMDTCSTCDGSCSGTCDDSCTGYCAGCGSNG